MLAYCIQIQNLKQPMQFTKKLVQGDPWTLAHPKSQWTDRKSDKLQMLELLVHTANKQISEARFGAPSSASLASLLWFPDEGTNIPYEPHAVAMLTRHVRHGHGTSPSGTGRSRQQKAGRHHRWQKGLLRECTQVWSNGSNEQRTHKLKQNLSEHCMVNRGKFEFRPSIKRHRL